MSALNTRIYTSLRYKMEKSSIKKDLAEKLKDVLIMRNDDGTYNLFTKYTITNINGNYKVHVDNYEDSKTCEFSSLKNAVTWCVFDKNNKFKDVRRIAELDEQLSSISYNIMQHTRLCSTAKSDEDKSIYMAKLIEEKRKKRRLSDEMQDYISISKHWQSKKYEENQVK